MRLRLCISKNFLADSCCSSSRDHTLRIGKIMRIQIESDGERGCFADTVVGRGLSGEMLLSWVLQECSGQARHQSCRLLESVLWV